MRFEAKLRINSCPLDHASEAGRGERRATLRREHEWRLGLLLALKPPQGSQFITDDRMRAGCTLLGPADVQRGRPKVDLIPSKVHQLGNPQAMSVGHEDHRSIPVAVAVARGGLHEPLDLGLGQIFAGS